MKLSESEYHSLIFKLSGTAVSELAFASRCRCHKTIQRCRHAKTPNLTPADVFFSRNKQVNAKRQRVKQLTLQ